MDLADNPELIKELVFLEIWETGLLPADSGAIRVRTIAVSRRSLVAAPLTLAPAQTPEP
jgi:hypothetical protein